MAPPELNPTQKIDYYIAQLQPQQTKLRENQLLQTWIQQWQQLHAWHKTRKEKEAAEADQQQIQQLKHQLQHKKLKPKRNLLKAYYESLKIPKGRVRSKTKQ